MAYKHVWTQKAFSPTPRRLTASQAAFGLGGGGGWAAREGSASMGRRTKNERTNKLKNPMILGTWGKAVIQSREGGEGQDLLYKRNIQFIPKSSET